MKTNQANKTNPKVSTHKRHKDKNCVENCWYCANNEAQLINKFIPARMYAEIIKNKKENKT